MMATSFVEDKDNENISIVGDSEQRFETGFCTIAVSSLAEIEGVVFLFMSKEDDGLEKRRWRINNNCRR